jgi:hypothetical protein
MISADAFELALLEHAHKSNLGLCGKIANLIEKESAAFGKLESP